MLNAEQMQSLPDFFANIQDPRRAQGRRRQSFTLLPYKKSHDDTFILEWMNKAFVA